MNIKERLSSIGFFFIFGLFFLAIIMIIVGLKTSQTNWTFVSIGIIISIPFWMYSIYINFSINHNSKKRGKLYDTHLRNLKEKADKIPVKLDNAIIQERNQYQKNTIVTGKAAALNEISGYGHHNEKNIKHTLCKVTFKLKYHQKELIIEETVHLGETALRMQFYIQKETTLYIDPFDPENYHLDLDFLEY
ncbi:MAG: hypothetical protein AB8B65_09530 [Kordia sp.]|uniref:hypothetical protein n=1 Tax=Kordia sp. TaxID=1965332 RepID=UPI00385DA6D0